MVQILKYFGWTWVGVLYSDDDYGIYAAQSFHQEMQRFGGCVAFSEIMPYDNHRDIQRIVAVIKASTARVVVAFSTDLLPLMDELLLQNVTGRQWIASEAWTTSPVLHLPRFIPSLGAHWALPSVEERSRDLMTFFYVFNLTAIQEIIW